MSEIRPSIRTLVSSNLQHTAPAGVGDAHGDNGQVGRFRDANDQADIATQQWSTKAQERASAGVGLNGRDI